MVEQKGLTLEAARRVIAVAVAEARRNEVGGAIAVVDGQVIGAVGVSGAASAKQDEEIAVVAAAAVEPSMAGASSASGAMSTTYLDHDTVAAAFAKGQPLLEVPGYKVHASRRDAPGVAEVHLWETDVIYVLDGEATFVTGGSVVEPQASEPGQVRGPAIEGGTERHLAKGDVIVVPNNEPHWFKEVTAPFLYFVVKPIAPKGDVS